MSPMSRALSSAACNSSCQCCFDIPQVSSRGDMTHPLASLCALHGWDMTFSWPSTYRLLLGLVDNHQWTWLSHGDNNCQKSAMPEIWPETIIETTKCCESHAVDIPNKHTKQLKQHTHTPNNQTTNTPNNFNNCNNAYQTWCGQHSTSNKIMFEHAF